MSNDAAVGEGREDGAILPHLFARLGFEVGLAHLSTPRTRLRGDLGVPGSFAVAAVDGSRPRELRLARSYRPLHLMRHPELPAVFFASAPDQLLPPAPPGELDLCRPRVEALPPHHVAILDARDGRVRLRPLPEARPAPRRRALVLASGGLRSTVAATMLLRHGFQVTLLRCRTESAAEEREARAAAAVAEALGCGLKTLGGPRSRGRLPVGNLLMVASACALADAEAFTHVALGVNGEDGGVGPGGTPEFLAAADLASRLGTWCRPRVIAPLAGLLGHEVARLGAAAGAPLHLTWSCLRGGDVPCGGCAGCTRRRAAFERDGLSESLHDVEDLVQARQV